MQLVSTNSNSSQIVSLQEAVLHSLPEDGGLYVPTQLPLFEPSDIRGMKGQPLADVSIQVASRLLDGVLPESELIPIVERAINFPAPLVELTPTLSVLELFHGPSLAFKDFGARFMAELIGYFNRDADDLVTILVATSGDTGGAVAAGFHGVPGVEVVILYPSGRVSELQERQLTTWGDNISACEVEGSFDDCQAMVKTAFQDPDLKRRYNLSSANSINIARLIPQSFYYFGAYAQMKGDNPVFVVPSGNYGNLTAGLLAKRMGLPVKHFVAASNRNDVVPKYLNTGEFHPKQSVTTLSNAMDVGNPSNFARMQHLYGSTWNAMRDDVVGYSYSDSETLSEMQLLYRDFGYICDPHGAIGALGAKEYEGIYNTGEMLIFLETAHPSKFIDVVQDALGIHLDIPIRLQRLQDLPKNAVSIPADYTAFKAHLMSR
ncbi:MAG: threonine synthase [Saprospiraceae bacterium]|nr:threonine synthase [Saprospiraceae bacterium]